jgi:hypothetical protein
MAKSDSNKFSFLEAIGTKETEPSPEIAAENITSAEALEAGNSPSEKKNLQTERVERSVDEGVKKSRVPAPTVANKVALPDNSSLSKRQESPKVGRPKGKRSNPDYEQVTTYIKRDTHMAVKMLLLQEKQSGDFSDLVQHLLEEYLKMQKSEISDV